MIDVVSLLILRLQRNSNVEDEGLALLQAKGQLVVDNTLAESRSPAIPARHGRAGNGRCWPMSLCRWG